MDDRGFDALTRNLATSRSRRSILRGLLGGGAALVAAKTGSALAAPAPKVDVCHWDNGSGSYTVINISQNGWVNGHSKHANDYLRTDCCIDADCPEGDACTSYTCDQGTCGEIVQEPVDCVVSDWVEGACSDNCGAGTAIRTRTILTEPSCGGAACPPLEEIVECTGVQCTPTISVAFSPTLDPNYCMVYVGLAEFTPATSYSGTYDIAGFGNQGSVGAPITTDASGDAGPIGVFSYYNQNRQINFNFGGTSSGYYNITC